MDTLSLLCTRKVLGQMLQYKVGHDLLWWLNLVLLDDILGSVLFLMFDA